MNDFKRGFGEGDYSPSPMMKLNSRSSRPSATGVNSEFIGFKKMGLAKRDTHKIKTNPKYKCVDDASEDEEQNHKDNVIQDPQEMSSKEI